MPKKRKYKKPKLLPKHERTRIAGKWYNLSVQVAAEQTTKYTA